MRFVKYLVSIVVIVFLFLFFSFRLLNSPLGLTADEASIGLNATLLSKTLHDENGWYLPLFVLTLGKTDWKQPVNIYLTALFFKLFGSTVFNLRFVMVLVTVVSSVLMFALAKEVDGTNFAISSLFIFVTTPLVLIQSHLAMENIMVVPFVLLWLIFLFKSSKNNNLIGLFWAGLFLGISFYSYKGMRAIVPVWAILSVFYLWSRKRIAAFFLGVLPFLTMTPYLEKVYPGAIFDGKSIVWDSWYRFLYPYLSSFDFSFLYITGDITAWHSTGKHGMMLLATLPIFLIGVYLSIRGNKFQKFALIALVCAPLLYGFVDSVHRASRLMCMIPSYVLICSLGIKWLLDKSKLLLVIFVAIAVLNYVDFAKFYWYEYPELTRYWFGDLSISKDYETFLKEIKNRKLEPYVDSRLADSRDVSIQFYDAAYFPKDTEYIDIKDYIEPPPHSLFLTEEKQVPGMIKLDVPMVKYNLFTNE